MSISSLHPLASVRFGSSTNSETFMSLTNVGSGGSLSFLAHSSNINNLLEGLNGILKDWLNRLHDTESSLHIINLWLHALDGLHLSGNFDEWLSVIESLEDSGSKSFLDVLDSSGLGNGGIGITTGFESLGLVELGLKGDEELVLIHGLISLHGLEELGLVVAVSVVSGSNSGSESEEFHVK